MPDEFASIIVVPSLMNSCSFSSLAPSIFVELPVASIMDPNLTFGNRVLQTVSSCMSRLAQINRVKYPFDKQFLIIIINSLVFSKLFLLFMRLE